MTSMRPRANSPLYRLVCCFCIALIFAFLIMSNFQLVIVSGDSMQPSYNDAEIVLCRKTSDVVPGDVVVFQHSDGRLLIKRIIAVEGQSVALMPQTGTVWVDDVILEDPYAAPFPASLLNAWPGAVDGTATTVPDDCLFVMGDNRANSADSRSASIGMVSVSQVVGRVIYTVVSDSG